MLVYRITHKKYSDKLVASGVENRWNRKGQMVIYTAATKALACLEILVHSSGDTIHAALYRCVEIFIPDNIQKTIVDPADVPKDPLEEKSKIITRKIGDEWYSKGATVVLRVPSVIITSEHNFIINTTHEKFKMVRIQNVEPFIFDSRLKR